MEKFEKVVRLYPPSDDDLREKQDSPAPKVYPSDLNLLPLAQLCPELSRVTVSKGSKEDHQSS